MAIQLKHVTLVGTGLKDVAPDPANQVLVKQMALTSTHACRIQFGAALPGVPVGPNFALAAGVPFVLPNSDEGWFVFPSGQPIQANVASATPGVEIAILVGVERA